ncbi:MAG: hypothetical protein LQ349_006684 [Xanthoria aureola]|nr:MAG: hypothetical protein LQ349_006684 [Xanthoria aureola]
MRDMSQDGDDRKPVKKRKSWGQELPTLKTNLPPRKRAKTEDEKEQRRIERVLRNRQTAQSSRERKRQEVEKLEGERTSIEDQNKMLKERLMAVEHDKFKLQQQNSQLAAELAALRSGSSSTRSSLAPSPNFAMELQQTIKQELDDSIHALRTPISLASDSFSPSHFASTDSRSPSPTPFNLGYHHALTATPDMTQHPAEMFYDSAYHSRHNSAFIQPTKARYSLTPPIIFSDPYYDGLFVTPPSPPAAISFLEDDFASTDPSNDRSNNFMFDSMFDLDAGGSNGIFDDPNIDNDSVFNKSQELFQDDDTLQADSSHQSAPASPALQPCLGAPFSGRDGSENAS